MSYIALGKNSLRFLFMLVAVFICSCNENKKCSQYREERHSDEPFDSIELVQAKVYRDTLLKRFNVAPIYGQNYNAYHLLFYSSQGYGRSIKFENKDSFYFLTVKCLSRKGIPSNCQVFHDSISKEEWSLFEKMINDFDFWEAPQLDSKKNVLDGYFFILEGNRPKTEKCERKTYHFIGRRSPEYDKIGALCDYIIDYEERLVLSKTQKLPN